MAEYQSWREKISGHRIPPDGRVWDRLESRLKDQGSGRRPRRLVYILAAATVLLVIAMSFLLSLMYFGDDSGSHYTAELMELEVQESGISNDIYSLDNVKQWKAEAAEVYGEDYSAE